MKTQKKMKRKYIIEVRRLFANGRKGKWHGESEMVATLNVIKEQIRKSNDYNNNIRARYSYCNNYEFRWRDSLK